MTTTYGLASGVMLADQTAMVMIISPRTQARVSSMARRERSSSRRASSKKCSMCIAQPESYTARR